MHLPVEHTLKADILIKTAKICLASKDRPILNRAEKIVRPNIGTTAALLHRHYRTLCLYSSTLPAAQLVRIVIFVSMALLIILSQLVPGKPPSQPSALTSSTAESDALLLPSPEARALVCLQSGACPRCMLCALALSLFITMFFLLSSPRRVSPPFSLIPFVYI